MRDTRHIDDYLIVPWMGFPFEEKPLLKALWLFTGLFGLLCLVLWLLQNSAQRLLGTHFDVLIEKFIQPAWSIIFYWGWLGVLIFSLWCWETLRSKEFRRVMKF